MDKIDFATDKCVKFHALNFISSGLFSVSGDDLW